mmetsp:Transcript_10569/g.25020  ORF Transcript_10569/g.25020 Transcript_10569/m.25020 type:complete len:536 (+) Transcript_10569:115-1722(+)
MFFQEQLATDTCRFQKPGTNWQTSVLPAEVFRLTIVLIGASWTVDSSGFSNAATTELVPLCECCSLNLGGRRTSNLVYPETVESALGHGLCGDAPLGDVDRCWGGGDCTEQDHMPGGRFYTPDGLGGEVQATYLAGQEIDVEFVITAHHRGVIELRLCDEPRATQSCFNKYPALKRVRYEDEELYSKQPINPEYPSFFYLNPVCSVNQDPSFGGYQMTARFKLPEGVSCEQCVIQMWWITANSCVPPGYRNFDFPAEWANCAGDGGSGWYTPGQADCLGTTLAEEFWNCADVKISPANGTLPPAATPVAGTPAPTPVASSVPQPPPVSTSEPPASCGQVIPVWGQCGGQADYSDACCEDGTYCNYQNQWYSQCIPGTASTPPVATSPSPQQPSPPPPVTTPPPTPFPEAPTATPSPTTSPPPSPPPATGCARVVQTYGQCAGPAVDGQSLCCASGDICVPMDEHYSQCRPDTSVTEPPVAGGGCNVQIPTWGKCGGRDRSYEGTCCSPGDTCFFVDPWFSQCRPQPSGNRKLLGV